MRGSPPPDQPARLQVFRGVSTQTDLVRRTLNCYLPSRTYNFLDTYDKGLGNKLLGSYYFWDPLAAAIATEEGLGTFQEISLIVVEEEGAESGRTLESERGIIMRVAMKADRERFEALFLDAVNGRLP